MKAFLSDRAHRMNWGGTVSCVDEAKRILAETEPEIGADVFLLSPNSIGAETLAEALERFISTLDKEGF
jgi:hypothetical protein